MDTFAAADKRQEALRILEQLELQGDIRPDEKRILDNLRAGADADNRTIGETGAAYRGLAQGATLGAADEVGAGVRSVASALSGGAVGAPYDESLTRIRNENDAAREQFPGEFQAGQVAGGAMTAVLPFGATMSAMRGATLGGQMLGSALTGTALAGIEGFNSGEGGAVNRLRNAADPVQLGIGAATGAVAPLAGRAVGGMLADARSPAGAPVAALGYAPQAAKLATRSFSDDAAVVGDVRGYLDNLGPEGMIADVGRNTRMQASGVARVPGQGGQIITSRMDARAEGAPARVAADVDAIGGGVQNQTAAAATRASDRSAQAGPLYEAAKAIPDPLDPTDIIAQIDGLIADRAPGSAALKRIRDALSEDARPVVMHNLRSDLSDDIAELRRAGRGKGVGTLTDVLEKMDAQLDTVPGYADARKIWADSKALDTAAEDGAAFLKKATTPDQLAADFARLSDPEKEAFRRAARAAIDQEMASAVQESNKALNLIGPRASRAKIETIFGPGSADTLMRRVDAEKTFRETRQKATQGSETAANEAAKREIMPLVDEAGNRLGPVQRARQASSEPVNQVIDALLRRPKGKALTDLAEILTAQGSNRDEIVRALIASQAGNAANKRISENTQRVLQALIQSGGGGLAMSASN